MNLAGEVCGERILILILTWGGTSCTLRRGRLVLLVPGAFSGSSTSRNRVEDAECCETIIQGGRAAKNR